MQWHDCSNASCGRLGCDRSTATSIRCASSCQSMPTQVRQRALEAGINFEYIDDRTVGISLNETVDGIFATSSTSLPQPSASHRMGSRKPSVGSRKPSGFRRRWHSSGAATNDDVHDASGVQRASIRDRDDAVHPSPRAEGYRPRHIDDSARLLHDEAELGNRDASRDMGALQPCASVCSRRSGAGVRKIFGDSDALCKITGFAAVSLQPNPAPRGEFAGLMVIRAYRQSRGEAHRDVVLIPASAHGPIPPARRWRGCASWWWRQPRTAAWTCATFERRPPNTGIGGSPA